MYLIIWCICNIYICIIDLHKAIVTTSSAIWYFLCHLTLFFKSPSWLFFYIFFIWHLFHEPVTVTSFTLKNTALFSTFWSLNLHSDHLLTPLSQLLSASKSQLKQHLLKSLLRLTARWSALLLPVVFLGVSITLLLWPFLFCDDVLDSLFH